MQKKKLKIEDIKIKSFVTDIDFNGIIGGSLHSLKDVCYGDGTQNTINGPGCLEGLAVNKSLNGACNAGSQLVDCQTNVHLECLKGTDVMCDNSVGCPVSDGGLVCKVFSIEHPDDCAIQDYLLYSLAHHKDCPNDPTIYPYCYSDHDCSLADSPFNCAHNVSPGKIFNNKNPSLPNNGPACNVSFQDIACDTQFEYCNVGSGDAICGNFTENSSNKHFYCRKTIANYDCACNSDPGPMCIFIGTMDDSQITGT